MQVWIRADASVDVGGGHVARCLALADGLRGQGAAVAFACQALPGDMRAHVAARGYPVLTLTGSLQEDADAAACLAAMGGSRPDWVVVDHYTLGESWERRLRAGGVRVLAIDDNPLRRHACDLLLDPNHSAAGAARWQAWVDEGTRVLAGTRFLLLREAFFDARRTLRERDGTVRRILVSMGASDRPGAACVAMRGLIALAGAGSLEGVEVDVVAGAGNPQAAELQRLTHMLPSATFHPHTDRMAELIAAADLALGAGGISVWERCYLGLPACVVILADNQREAVHCLAGEGALVSLGEHQALTATGVAAAVRGLLDDPDRLRALSAQGRALAGEPDFVRNPLAWLS